MRLNSTNKRASQTFLPLTYFNLIHFLNFFLHSYYMIINTHLAIKIEIT